MLATLNSLNVHNMFQPIVMILVSKFMVHRVLSDETNTYHWVCCPL